ncbi:hypothetical protein BBO99_00003855 [Phytophthora kernoviae]|uniref:Uncharacterized protein n=2 Tax=Phytophthora kernoviae TaxID=325452 RepID=A0A3R7J861_9STRA|nr:hypothetical protein G195_004418 [Phytophthora kernoviae 00238/432]KAG2526663.1 hypothetical protein JM16_003592 [Phytophthora kernoviae]KAG2528358.1 hypothetical protein JM18_003298 [Phytophthora kernoviae]RLN37371.1 hypothetical protein BBI17_003984 [Phytophthora kernoviae]RLN81257.1 hypothetical protein BBO99_00003855 [Phytophthora kernoviae]
MDDNRKRVLALSEKGDWDDVLRLVDLNPALANTQDNFGMLPLHWACTEPTVKLDVVTTLIEAFPEASALAKDGNGHYPVDLAIANNLPNFTIGLIRKAGARVVHSATKLHERSASMDDLTSVSSCGSAHTNQSDNEVDRSAFMKARSISSMSQAPSEYGQLLDQKLRSGSMHPVDSATISLQLKDLLSQLHQLSVDIRVNNTSSSGSTYRSSFSSAFSSSGHRGDSLTSVLWNPSDRFGIILEPAVKELGARIKGFASRSAVLGVEALAVDDVLMNINGTSVMNTSFASIMRFLKHSKGTCKLRFVKSSPDPTIASKCSTGSNPAAEHDSTMYSKVVEMLETTLKKVSAVEETVRLSSAVSLYT